MKPKDRLGEPMPLRNQRTHAARAYGALCLAAATGTFVNHFAFPTWEALTLAALVGVGCFLLTASLS
jgi:hypothetical protein